MTFEIGDEALEARLTQIKVRLQWISDLEAESAKVGGLAAQGMFLDEGDLLARETDMILDIQSARNAKKP